MIQVMSFIDFERYLNAIANCTDYEKLDSTKIKTYWESFKDMPYERLQWTLCAAADQCTKFPTVGIIRKLSKDYHKPTEKRDMSGRESCSLKEAIVDPTVRRAWDKLDPEFRKMFKKIGV